MAATKFKVKKSCGWCGGTGVMPVGSVGDTQPCPQCSGSGDEELCWIKLKEIEDKLDQIIELVTPSE